MFIVYRISFIYAFAIYLNLKMQNNYASFIEKYSTVKSNSYIKSNLFIN